MTSAKAVALVSLVVNDQCKDSHTCFTCCMVCWQWRSPGVKGVAFSSIPGDSIGICFISSWSYLPCEEVLQQHAHERIRFQLTDHSEAYCVEWNAPMLADANELNMSFVFDSIFGVRSQMHSFSVTTYFYCRNFGRRIIFSWQSCQREFHGPSARVCFLQSLATC